MKLRGVFGRHKGAHKEHVKGEKRGHGVGDKKEPHGPIHNPLALAEGERRTQAGQSPPF